MWSAVSVGRGGNMALHKIKLQHPDGTAATFYENPDGTWDYCLHNGGIPNWFNSLSTQMMISTVCAASDLGAEIKIEKGEDQ